MAYDEDLANRIREVMASLDVQVTEKKMFGGLAFLVDGKMSVSASGQGGLLLRVPTDQTEMLVAEPHAERAVMRGREMDGWLRVAPEGVEDDAALRLWVQTAVANARTLPPNEA
jgi:TfoX/Sxy family transcriptional regulator of competence genes